MQLACVDPLQAADIWPHVRFLIWHAMRRGGLSSFGPLERSVLAGVALVWLALDGKELRAAAVTELAVTEWGKSCTIVACGGNGMREWLPLITGLEKYAIAEGCGVMRIVGRKGWARMLPEYGARVIILEKDLSHGR